MEGGCLLVLGNHQSVATRGVVADNSLKTNYFIFETKVKDAISAVSCK